MNIAVCKINIRLPENSSLKGKRQVLRSITSRVRNKFNVSIAETGNQDLWQLATIGIAYVSNNGRHANEVLSSVIAFINEANFDIEVLDYHTEIVSVLSD